METVARETLSICVTWRDSQEAERGDMQGGARLADTVYNLVAQQCCDARLRGVRCMSQCKRPCVVSLTAPGAFTYVFGDFDPENPAHA